MKTQTFLSTEELLIDRPDFEIVSSGYFPDDDDFIDNEDDMPLEEGDDFEFVDDDGEMDDFDFIDDDDTSLEDGDDFDDED